MYKLKINGTVYTIPKENIKALALTNALDRGITHGNIHDDKTAIEFLESIGLEISEG